VLIPGLVLHDWNVYGGEEVFMEATVLGVVPGEPLVLNAHEMVH